MGEEKIWKFLESKGFTDFGVFELMGNLYAGSKLGPVNPQNPYEKKLNFTDQSYTQAVDSSSYIGFVKGAAGYGLAQWTYWNRKQNLSNYIRSAGKSIGDLDMQLEFLYKEFSGYSTVWKTLQFATSVFEASNTVLLQHERPVNQSGAVQNERADYGQAYYDKFVQSTTKEGVGSLTAIERLIVTAKAERGYLEEATNAQLDNKTANTDSNNWIKYACDLNSIGNIYNGKENDYAWCDAFADQCFIKTFGVGLAMKLLCQPYGGVGVGCTHSVQYYKQKGQFHKGNPQAGDQISSTNDGGITSYHTRPVIVVGNGKVYMIKGSASNASGTIPNSGCVRAKSYNSTATYIYGYGRPDWSLVGGSTEQEDGDMALDGFEELMKEYRVELQDNDCGTWSKGACEWAIANGLVGSTRNNTNGKPNYAWADQLIREQVAALFYCFARLMDKA